VAYGVSISSRLAPAAGVKGLGLAAMRLLMEQLCTRKHKLKQKQFGKVQAQVY